MQKPIDKAALDRRDFVGAGVALITTTVVFGQAAKAGLPEAEAAIAEVLGDREPVEDRISLKLPEIAEDGHTVPLKVEVESPMTAEDHVVAVHIFADGNPHPTVTKLTFTPRSGEAIVSTRIRLARTQTVRALAEMSDGSVFATARHVNVTIGGCGS